MLQQKVETLERIALNCGGPATGPDSGHNAQAEHEMVLSASDRTFRAELAKFMRQIERRNGFLPAGAETAGADAKNAKDSEQKADKEGGDAKDKTLDEDEKEGPTEQDLLERNVIAGPKHITISSKDPLSVDIRDLSDEERSSQWGRECFVLSVFSPDVSGRMVLYCNQLQDPADAEFGSSSHKE
jgi:hypothetical protein